MNFLIEYLRDPANEQSVCRALEFDGQDLIEAETEAWQCALSAFVSKGANAFQIRDADGRIVLREILAN